MNILNRFTLQTLKKNKIRTLVTIIGIILSTAMFTAITSSIFSLQQYLIDIETDVDGAWYGRINDLNEKDLQELLKKDEITENSCIYNIGYSALKDCLNPDKPYLCIESIDSTFTEMSSITLIEGRMPKNNSEIIISEHVLQNGGISYALGDTLNLEIGTREAGEGTVLGQQISYLGEKEQLTVTTTKQYTVVGICERPYFESYSAPGYTAFTTGESDFSYSCDVLFQTKNPEDISSFINKFVKKANKAASIEITSEIHMDLLRFMGKSPDENYMSILYGMGAILIAIIMIASISLIYNAFSISISERTKQFGLLKSIGATKKQIRQSVLFEAFSLCAIGIPSGIGFGLLGIGITLHFVGDLLAELMTAGTSLKLKLYISSGAIWWAILISAAIALATVTISAMLPARRAVKMPAIQALRESNEIKIRSKNVKSGKLIYKLFGFEGMLANKNLKRNKRKHRLTVASLALSVILFLSTSCFSNYMMASTQIMDSYEIHDISFYATRKELNNHSFSKVTQELKQLKHVDAASYAVTAQGIVHIDEKQLNSDYLEQIENSREYVYDSKNKKYVLNTCIYYIDDATYKTYLEQNKLDTNLYLNTDHPLPLVWDLVNLMTEDGTYFTSHVFAKNTIDGDFYTLNRFKGYAFSNIESLSDLTFNYEEVKEESSSTEKAKEITFDKEKALTHLSSSQIERMEKKLPLGATDARWQNAVTVILPYSATGILPEVSDNYTMAEFQIQAKKHAAATTAITDFFKNSRQYYHPIASRVNDVSAINESSKALILIINIFSYGFITLITLIVIANVFNTISTNIQLRRKEFAMLKSVGMTKRGFDRMMNYECLLYGLKGLLIGLPVSFGLSYLMYKALLSAWTTSFMMPWISVLIACISVFIVVFASMLYSMSKVKKDNPIEALRNDNL